MSNTATIRNLFIAELYTTEIADALPWLPSMGKPSVEKPDI